MSQNNDALNYDLIVVGAGNAALCAAISAREQELKVLVLEKGPIQKRGGNSFFTDGAIRFAFSGVDDIRKIIPSITDEEASTIVIPEYMEENYYEDLMRVTNNQSNPELAKQLVSKSYETIKWMHNQGVTFELIYNNQSFEKNGKRHFWGGLPVKTQNIGIGLIKSLNARAQELGIEVWYDSRAISINKREDKISSVTVQQGEKKIEVSTSSVILACGSFEANKEMRKENIGEEWSHAIVRGTEFNTGDGILMALRIGAQKHGQWSGCHSIGTDYKAPKVGDFKKPGDIYKKHSYPFGIMLNKDGKRFVDEGADFRNYTYAKYGREILKQPEHIAFQIFDQQVRPMLREEYNLEEATFYQADTLEDLVGKLPVNGDQFLKTIKEYNEGVKEGDYNPTEKDGKCTTGINPSKTNWALRIEKGPFYAFPVTCGITFSFGGLKVDSTGHVLSIENKPLKGLFAAGEMIGGIFYDNYPGGSGLMSGAVFGKLAGESASNFIKSEENNTIKK